MSAFPRTLPTYLWKEWRDHRAVIVAYLIAAPLLLAIGFSLIEEDTVRIEKIAGIATLAGFSIAALAFGADLVPGELRRQRLPFLARLPCDLRGAFVAKLVFFVAMLALFAVWSCASARLASAWFLHAASPRPSDWREAASYGRYLLVGASWLFAVSCWMSRGTFALPATALALAAWLAPVFGAFLMNPGMKLHEGEIESAASWLAVAGIVAAALAFLRGWRHGGTLRSRLTWSMGPALFAFAPVWGWAALRVHEYRHLDPRAATFRIQTMAFGVDGRFAFVNGYHDLTSNRPPAAHPEWGASHPLIVDVATGGWREVGDPGDLFWFLGPRWEQARAASVLLVEGKLEPGVPAASQFKDGFDAASGQPLNGEQWKALLRGKRAEERVYYLASAFTILPDGSRVRVVDGTARLERPDGSTREVAGTVGDRWLDAAGSGLIGENYYYDLLRERAWRKKDCVHDVLWIRPGSWVVRKTLPGTGLDACLWDPDRKEYAPILGTKDGRFLGVHPDGRMIVVEAAAKAGEPPASGALVLLDPATGIRHEQPLPHALAQKLHLGGWSHGINESGDLLLTLLDGSVPDHTMQWIARLDPRDDVFVCIGPFEPFLGDLVGCPDRDTVVFVTGQRRLLRAYFDGRPAEVLFPR